MALSLPNTGCFREPANPLCVPKYPDWHKRLNLIGGVDWLTGEAEVEFIEGNGTGQVVIHYHYSLAARAKLAGKPVVVVMDRASIHLSEAVALKQPHWEKDGLYLGLIPAYSPHLNPMECIWRLLKYHLLPRRFYENLKALREAIEAVIPRLRLPELELVR